MGSKLVRRGARHLIWYTSDQAYSMWSIASIVMPLCLVSLVAPGFCADLSMPAQFTGPGAILPVAVSFSSGGESVSGLQFDLAYDTSVLSLSAVVGDATRNSGKTLYMASPSSGQTRLLITELNQNPIADGSVVSLFVNVKPGATPGVYAIQFLSAVASDPSGHAIAMTTADGSITVQSVYGAPVLAESVLNAASLVSGPVAPGELITILGSAIVSSATPGSTRITFDGLTAPLLYTGTNQINAVVPFGIDGRSLTTMEVSGPSGIVASSSIPVAPSAPAIFALNGSGTGGGAVLNQDGSINSPDNPASSGSIIVLFATGAGQTDPAGADGLVPSSVLPKPLLPISVSIGGANAGIVYAGAAPGLISGMLQVNCQVPAQAKGGRSVPVLLTIGKATSPPVTVAIN